MKFIVSLLLLVIALKTAAQADIVCPKLTDSTLNYFYIGVDNPIKIIGHKITDNYTVSISGGGAVITKISANNYIVKVNTVADDCRIVMKGINGKIILKKDFKVREIRDPVTSFAGTRDTAIMWNRILLNPVLSVVIPNCYFQLYYQVLSFNASFINHEDSVIDIIVNGNLLSQEQLSLVKEAVAGSRIYFDNIRVMCPDGRTRKVPSFWIKIE